MDLEEAVSAHHWSPGWWWQPSAFPRAPVGSVLLCWGLTGSTHLWVLPPPLCTPPSNGVLHLWWIQASRYTLSVAKTWSLHTASAPNPGPLSGTMLWESDSALNSHPHQQRCISGWEVHGRGANPLGRLFSLLSSTDWLLLSLLKLPNPTSIQHALSATEETSQGVGNFPPSQLFPQCAGPILTPSFSLLKTSEVFCQCLVAVFLWIFPLVDAFSMFLWREVNSASYSSAILILTPSLNMIFYIIDPI